MRPPVSLIERRIERDFRQRIELRLPVDANLVAPMQHVYASPLLDVGGYTIINGLVSLSIVRDNTPAANIQIEAALTEIEGTQLSPRSVLTTLAGQAVQGYRGPDTYGLALATSTDALVSAVRFIVWAVSNTANHELTVDIVGTLVAGPRVGRG